MTAVATTITSKLKERKAKKSNLKLQGLNLVRIFRFEMRR